jgi:Ca2+-binding RTX toxin-like protein
VARTCSRARAGPDVLHGNRGNDTLVGDVPLVGDKVSQDRLYGGRGNDTLRGGDGFDRLHGGPGADTANGNAGNDLMSGGSGPDNQSGGPGDDTIFANRGVDITSGGPGNDTLFALARRDVHGRHDTTGDTVRGDEGDDTIRVRDGEQDVVNCGPGTDTAFLDFKDRIEDASRRTRTAPARSSSALVRTAPTRVRRTRRRSPRRTRRPSRYAAHTGGVRSNVAPPGMNAACTSVSEHSSSSSSS